MSEASVVIVAAGRGRRFGSPKQFLSLAGRPLLQWSVDAFLAHPGIVEVVVVLPEGSEPAELPTWLSYPSIKTCRGGDTRRVSAGSGVRAVSPDALRILIHDAARPFVSHGVIDRVLGALDDHPAVVPTVPVVDTIKRVREGRVVETVDRSVLKRAQTPQGFEAELVRGLHARARQSDAPASDDAALCERAGHRVAVVEGDPWNLKITTPDDFELAEWLVESGRVDRTMVEKERP
jgi:2-C-methyl-D-erythritol 4-phosphate cytidylyltransferase/2-C-methyl-D-erythritol 2,4-cyclodiphosphate synthase